MDGGGARNEGRAASLPSAHMPLQNADKDLRNSRKPTAKKAGRFCDHQITKSGDPAQEIIRFLAMCRLCPTFLAVGFLEFLRYVSAYRNGICAFGRLSASPSFCWVHPIGSKACLLGAS